MNIPFLPLKSLNQPYTEEFKNIFEEFLESGYYILGKGVKDFEEEFANYCQAEYAIGVANGLDALELIFQSLNLPEKSEIIVPANTYYASIISVINSGLNPIFAEPQYHDFLIDPEDITKKITPKTKAILAVNLYGKMCDYNELLKICEDHHLYLIIDAAQSHGADYKGKKNISGAIATAYSFYPTKNLGALADAGAVVTDNFEVFEKISKLRNYGSNVRYNFELVGKNSRLSELQAKFLSLKLKNLDEEINTRRKIAGYYFKNIRNTNIILPPSNSINEDGWHLFVIKTKERERFTKYLTEAGIGFDIHYPKAPHHQIALEKYSKLNLLITEQIHREVVSLPLNSTLKEEEIAYIADKINKFMP